MRRYTPIIFLFILTGLQLLVQKPLIAEELPNIVVLFADDAGYSDFGFQRDCQRDMRNLTPRIDSIAASGCRFSNAYMSGQVCSPSRAGLMTGRYQQRFGHDNNIPPGYMKGGLPLSETLIGERLKKSGYQTGIIGKWHLGYPDTYHPNERGFDFFYGCLQGSRSYFPMESPTPHRVFLRNSESTPEKGYTTDRIGDGACQFIDANKNQPFFLFVSFTAPHGPLQAKPEVLEKLSEIGNVRRRKYAGLVVSLDVNVGKILDCLKKNKLERNTLVLFTNDNGGQTLTGAVNAPLRGRKGDLWEGGIRVPMAARWPAVIPPATTIDAPVISLDFLPTFLDAAGIEVVKDWKLDGVSLLEVLKRPETELPERSLYWRKPGEANAIAVRRGRWKMVHYQGTQQGTSEPRLFDLSKDLSEQNDVASQHPHVVKRLQEDSKLWNASLAQPLWGPGSKGYRPRRTRPRGKF